MAQQVSSSAVVKEMMKTVGKSWDTNRTVQDEGSYVLAVPNNTVVLAKLTKAFMSLYKTGEKLKGKPYISFRWVIVSPDDYAGQQVPKKHNMFTQGERTADMASEYLARDLQRMGEDTAGDKASLPKLPALLVALIKKKKVCKLHLSDVANNFGPRVEIMGLAGDEEIPEDTDATVGDDDQAGDDAPADDDQPADDTDAEQAADAPSGDDDEYEEWSPQIKDIVTMLPPFGTGKAAIMSINETKGTCTLRDLKSKKVLKDVSFENLEPVD